MHILRREVSEALTGLSQHQAPPEGDPLMKLVQTALSGVEVNVSRVKRVGKGQFVAKWHRKRGILTEETEFTLQEPSFVKSWADAP